MNNTNRANETKKKYITIFLNGDQYGFIKLLITVHDSEYVYAPLRLHLILRPVFIPFLSNECGRSSHSTGVCREYDWLVPKCCHGAGNQPTLLSTLPDHSVCALAKCHLHWYCCFPECVAGTVSWPRLLPLPGYGPVNRVMTHPREQFALVICMHEEMVAVQVCLELLGALNNCKCLPLCRTVVSFYPVQFSA